jgi:anti-anti-sigma factor
MDIEMRELKHVSVVKVSGRVDSSTAPELEKSMQSLMDSDRNQIVLDLQDTEYMSSAGLRVLVAVHKATKKNGGGLCLAQPSPRVSEVLDLSGLTPVFDVRADLVDAVGSF